MIKLELKRINKLAGALFRQLRRLFGLKEMCVQQAISKGQVVTHHYQGEDISWLITNPEDEIQRKQVDSIFYERQDLQNVFAQLKQANLILDVGANIGNHAIFFERMYRPEKIILIEPQQMVIKHLLANIALNYSPAFDLSYLGVALAEKRGKGIVTSPSRFNVGISKVVESSTGGVDLLRGDDIIQGRKIDLIKIDVEGMEYQVLEGLEATLKASNPLIFVEISGGEHTKVVTFLARLSYSLIFESQMYEGMKNCMFRRDY
jgi:FkbM family methyltransferase